MRRTLELTDEQFDWDRAIQHATRLQTLFQTLASDKRISTESIHMILHQGMSDPEFGATGSGLQAFKPLDETRGNHLIFGFLDHAYAEPHSHPMGEYVVTLFGELFDRGRDGQVISLKTGESLRLVPGSFHQPWAEEQWMGLLVQPERVELNQMSMEQLKAALAWCGSNAPWHQRWEEVTLIQTVLWVKEAYNVRSRPVLAG